MSATRPVMLLMSTLLVAGCDGFFESPHSAVEAGNEAMAGDNMEGALAAYEEAAAELPESPPLDFDRGVALSGVGRHDEATQRLLRALQTKDPALRTRVHAALGAAYSRWGLALERAATAVANNPAPDMAIDAPPVAPPDPMQAAMPKWERAVDHLEKALRSQPDPAVLRNLEIALRRVDPPCSSRNDDHEPNDRPEQATVIELTAGQPAGQSLPGGQAPAPDPGAQDTLTWTRQLHACPDDVDWFAVPLQGGDRLRVTLNADEEGGQLGIALHAPGGVSQLAPSPDVFGLPKTVVYTVPAGADGPYLIRMWNVYGEERSYGLEVEMRPACERVEDAYEENDGPGEAIVLTPGTLDGLKICPEDEDWFQVVLAEGESVFVFASVADEGAEDEEADADPGAKAPKVPPPIDIEIMGPEGEVLSNGSPAGAGEVATLLMP